MGITAGSREVPGRNAGDRRHTYCIIIIIIIIAPTKIKIIILIVIASTNNNSANNNHNTIQDKLSNFYNRKK